MKRPVISIVGRNPNEISKIVKLFYSRSPQFGWVTFDSMITDSKPPSPLRRVDYAERLKKNFATVWVDRISTFGTVPLEAMKAGSIPIGLLPDITPEYLLDEKGEFICEINDWGQVIVDLSMKTSVPGRFAAGDIRIEAPKQVVSAAGDGAIAALQVISYIQEQQ